MCYKASVITEVCPDGHAVAAQVCVRQCEEHAAVCGRGESRWNTCCDELDSAPPIVFTCDTKKEASPADCTSCQVNYSEVEEVKIEAEDTKNYMLRLKTQGEHITTYLKEMDRDEAIMNESAYNDAQDQLDKIKNEIEHYSGLDETYSKQIEWLKGQRKNSEAKQQRRVVRKALNEFEAHIEAPFFYYGQHADSEQDKEEDYPLDFPPAEWLDLNLYPYRIVPNDAFDVWYEIR